MLAASDREIADVGDVLGGRATVPAFGQRREAMAEETRMEGDCVAAGTEDVCGRSTLSSTRLGVTRRARRALRVDDAAAEHRLWDLRIRA